MKVVDIDHIDHGMPTNSDSLHMQKVRTCAYSTVTVVARIKQKCPSYLIATEYSYRASRYIRMQQYTCRHFFLTPTVGRYIVAMPTVMLYHRTVHVRTCVLQTLFFTPSTVTYVSNRHMYMYVHVHVHAHVHVHVHVY